LYAAIARFSIRRWVWVLGTLLVLVGVAGLTIPKLGITTNRFGMVSSDNPHQARLEAYFERFGYPDLPVVLVRGGEPELRQQVVDDLQASYEAMPILEGRVLARLGPEVIAEFLFVQDPHVIAELRDMVGSTDRPLPDLIEGGLPALMDVVGNRLQSGLDGDDAGPAQTQDQQNEGFRQLGTIAEALARQVRGEDDSTQLRTLSGLETVPERRGIDERGYFVGWEGDHHLVALFPVFESGEVTDIAPVIGQIREASAEVESRYSEQGIEVMVTGLPVFSTDEISLIREGILVSSILTGLAIFLLQLYAFRSLRMAIYVQLPLGIGLILTLGTVWLLYGYLTIVTSSFIAILLGLGIDFSIHILARNNEIRRQGLEPAPSMIKAMQSAGPGVAVGAITTVIAFATTMTTEFTAFAELGIITSIGLLVMMVVALFVMPALAGQGWGGNRFYEAKIHGIGYLPKIVRAVPKAMVIVAVLAALAGSVAFPQVGFNARYFDFLPDESQAAIALDLLEEDGAMSPAFACLQAPDFEAAREKADKLRELSSVADVQTPTDLAPELTPELLGELRAGFQGLARQPDFDRLAKAEVSAQALAKKVDRIVDLLDEVRFELKRNERDIRDIDGARGQFANLAKVLRSLPGDGADQLGSLQRQLAGIMGRAWRTGHAIAERGKYAPEDMPELFKVRFMATDGSGAVAIFATPKLNIWELDHADAFNAQLTSVDPEATGFAVTLHAHHTMIFHGFGRAVAVAAVLVFIVVLIQFRRLGDALLVMFPVVLGWSWMIGTMAVFSLPLNVVNIVVLPLVVGIGIDAAVHVMHRTRQSAELNGGVAKLSDLLEGTGSAVLLSSLTTIFAFGGLVVGAEYGGMLSLGLAMMIGVSCCLLACVVVLPALLVLLKRAR